MKIDEGKPIADSDRYCFCPFSSYTEKMIDKFVCNSFFFIFIAYVSFTAIKKKNKNRNN